MNPIASNILPVLTSLTSGPEFEFLQQSSQVHVLRTLEEVRKLPASTKVIARFAADAADHRCWPRPAEYARAEAQREKLVASGVVRPYEIASYIYRFWFLRKSFFSAAPMQVGGFDGTGDPYMLSVWAANNFVDQQGPLGSFWYADIGHPPAWKASNTYVHDVGLAGSADLGPLLQPQIFYQALSAVLLGGCCR